MYNIRSTSSNLLALLRVYWGTKTVIMKKPVVIILISLSSIGWSQSFTPMPDSAGVWVNEWVEYYLDQNMFPIYYPPKFVNYCSSGHDTTINSTIYTEIDSCGAGYKGAMRETNGQVYYVPNGQSVEYLLYDFTVDTGDTIYDVYMEDFWSQTGGLYDLVVPSNGIDSILINGDYRTTIELGAGMWIEGIGCSQGLFMDPFGNISNFFIYLNCHSALSNTLYPSFATVPCTMHFTDYEKDELSTALIYPNPAFNELTVELESSTNPVYIQMLNLQGQVVFDSEHSVGNLIILDIEFLNAGAYFLHLSSGDSHHIYNVIKM